MGGPGVCRGKEYEEFANFLPCSLDEDGITYASVEHYFQAHKTEDVEARRGKCAGKTPRSLSWRL